jgi:hypothetical protein
MIGSNKPSLLITHGDTWCGFYIGHALLKSHQNNVSKVVMAVTDRNNDFVHELEKMGAEIREYDPINMDKHRLAKELFRGDIDGLVLVPVHNVTHMVDACKNMIEAAEMEEKCHCLLMWSTLGVQISGRSCRTTAPKTHKWRKILECFHEVEQLVRQSKMGHECILRLNFVSQQFFGMTQLIQQRGVFPLTSGKAKFSPVNAHDVAEATARMITSPEMMKQYNKQVFTLTGPHSHSGTDIVSIMNKALNTKVDFQEVSLHDIEKILESNDTLDEFDVRLTMAYMDLLEEDKLDITTQDMQKILGKPPRDLDMFFKDNPNSFRPRSANSSAYLAETRRIL